MYVSDYLLFYSLVFSYLIFSCLILSSLVLSCTKLSYLLFSCLVFYCLLFSSLLLSSFVFSYLLFLIFSWILELLFYNYLPWIDWFDCANTFIWIITQYHQFVVNALPDTFILVKNGFSISPTDCIEFSSSIMEGFPSSLTRNYFCIFFDRIAAYLLLIFNSLILYLVFLLALEFFLDIIMVSTVEWKLPNFWHCFSFPSRLPWCYWLGW